MHEHSAAAVSGTLLSALLLCSVLAATLVLSRRLVEDWTRLHDRTTPATHAGMGAVMVYTMVVQPARPVMIAAGAALLLAAGIQCRRVLGRGRAFTRLERIYLFATAVSALVMALMLLVVERGTALTAALLACLLVCGVIYAGTAVAGKPGNRRNPSELPPLAMTAGMAVMIGGV
jgi:hypothetical protein